MDDSQRKDMVDWMNEGSKGARAYRKVRQLETRSSASSSTTSTLSDRGLVGRRQEGEPRRSSHSSLWPILNPYVRRTLTPFSVQIRFFFETHHHVNSMFYFGPFRCHMHHTLFTINFFFSIYPCQCPKHSSSYNYGKVTAAPLSQGHSCVYPCASIRGLRPMIL